jgi:hypothetical protein
MQLVAVETGRLHAFPLEAPVTGNTRVVAITVLGAVVGSIVGYLLFTEEGRSFRRQMEPALDDLAQELSSYRKTLASAIGTASEGWKLLTETFGEFEGSVRRYPAPHQTSPF